jgi:hypothetical protein
MIEKIPNFYKEVVAPVQININPQGMTRTIFPITRLNFLVGSGLAAIFLIQKIALSIFF